MVRSIALFTVLAVSLIIVGCQRQNQSNKAETGAYLYPGKLKSAEIYIDDKNKPILKFTINDLVYGSSDTDYFIVDLDKVSFRTESGVSINDNTPIVCFTMKVIMHTSMDREIVNLVEALHVLLVNSEQTAFWYTAFKNKRPFLLYSHNET